MLPYATSLGAPRAPGADVRIATALGSDSQSAADAIASLTRRLGAPSSLRELGLLEQQLEEAVELVDETLSRLAQPVSRVQTEALLPAVFEGAAPTVEVSAG